MDDVTRVTPRAAPPDEETAEVAVEPEPRAPAHRGRFGAWLKETVIIVISALVLSMVIKTFLVQSFYIPSGSCLLYTSPSPRD